MNLKIFNLWGEKGMEKYSIEEILAGVSIIGLILVLNTCYLVGLFVSQVIAGCYFVTVFLISVFAFGGYKNNVYHHTDIRYYVIHVLCFGFISFFVMIQSTYLR